MSSTATGIARVVESNFKYHILSVSDPLRSSLNFLSLMCSKPSTKDNRYEGRPLDRDGEKTPQAGK